VNKAIIHRKIRGELENSPRKMGQIIIDWIAHIASIMML